MITKYTVHYNFDNNNNNCSAHNNCSFRNNKSYDNTTNSNHNSRTGPTSGHTCSDEHNCCTHNNNNNLSICVHPCSPVKSDSNRNNCSSGRKHYNSNSSREWVSLWQSGDQAVHDGPAGEYL